MNHRALLLREVEELPVEEFGLEELVRFWLYVWMCVYMLYMYVGMKIIYVDVYMCVYIIYVCGYEGCIYVYTRTCIF